MSLFRSLGKLSWLDLVIGLALVGGGAVAYLTGAERSRVQTEFDRLTKLNGDLVIHDPKKVYVRVLPSKDPHEFAWRVYLPPKQGETEGREEIARWGVFRFDDRMLLWYQFPDRKKDSLWLPPAVGAIFEDRWEQIEFIRAGAERQEVFDAPSAATLLRIRISESALKQARVAAEDISHWVDWRITLGS